MAEGPEGLLAFPFRALLTDITNEWDTAEHDIKVAQQVAHKTNIPAVKELRYAGRRVIDAVNAALAGEDVTKVSSLLEDARFCCYRARHDAIDASLDYIADDLQLMTRKLRSDNVIAVAPDFPDLLASVIEARLRVAGSRKERKNRNEVYKTVSEIDFVGTELKPGIVRRYAKLKVSKPLILAARARQKRTEYLTWLLGIVAVTSLIVNIFK